MGKHLKKIIFSIVIFFLVLPSNQDSCTTVDDCRSYYKCIDEKCVHKDFFPLNIMQFIEIIVMMLFSAIATSSGIGGGAIYSTLFMVMENFDASKAFPISNFMILFSSLSVYLLGAKMSMDVPEHKFVDYDLVIVFAPMMLLGTKIGVILNALTPSLVLTILLILTLIDSTRKIYKKYVSTKKQESEVVPSSFIKKGDDRKISDDSTGRRLSHSYIISKYTSPKAVEIIDKLKAIDLLKVDLFEEDQPIRWQKLRIIGELLIILLIDQLIEGSSKINSIFGLKKCTLYYNLTFISFIIICLLITYSLIMSMRFESKLSNLFANVLTKKKAKADGFNITKCDEKQLRSVVFFAFVSGIVAGMLGIGGGVVIAPLFFELGINPKIATSTSNFLLVFSSCSSTLQYLLANQLTMDYGLILSLLCMVSSLIGFKFINEYVRSTGKSSFLVFSLLIVMILSLLLLPVAGIRKILYQVSQGESIMAFKSFCNN